MASPTELLEDALARVAKLNPEINAVVLVQEYTARKAIKAGLPNGPFKGVPFLIKDLGAEAIDFPTHSGSNLLRDTTYSFESEIYRRIRRTGMVTFGRTTSPEVGIGPVTESAVYDGPTRNPWDTSRTAGGSSGGSGAAVAAGIVPMAHGSDGGGSVRIPASSCGLFGFKATRARFPDGPASGEGWGGMAIDGFLSKSVRDNARMMDACTGPDKGADYVNAINTIHAYGREMERVFDNCNILLSATLSEPPAKVGRFNHDREDYENYRIGPGGVFEYSPFCATFNASGQPAATVPMHWTTNGLPVGVHFASAFGEDATLIALCAELEEVSPWAQKYQQCSLRA